MYPASMVQRAPGACGCRRPKVPDDGRAAPAAQHAASFKAITPASFKRLLGGALAARSPRLVQIRLRHAWRLCRSEEHTSELQSQSNLVCRLLLEKKKKTNIYEMTYLERTLSTTKYVVTVGLDD